MVRRHRTRLWLQALEDRRVPAIFTVSTVADAGGGSLRDAIMQSNSTAGADTIDFNSSFSTAKTISLLSELPTITDDLAITGPGSKLLTVTRDSSAGSFRIFTIKNLNTVLAVSMSGMKITNGYCDATSQTDNGGGIYVGPSHSLTLDSVEIVGNSSSAQGGGIAMDQRSRLTVVNSTISGNAALGLEGGPQSDPGFTGVGGGIYFTLDGDLTVLNSTIDGNTAKVCGAGVFLYGESLGSSTIRNTTISSNTVTNTYSGLQYNSGGGGIAVLNNSFSGGAGIFILTLQNSTVTGNTTPGSSQGGGIQLGSLSDNKIKVRIESSIVAGNTAYYGADIYGDALIFSVPISTQQVTVDYSAIGTTSGFTLTPGPGGASTNQTNKSFALGALAYNPATATVRTHLPLAGSGLIDKGSNPAALGTDARGWSRYYNDTSVSGLLTVDIGAAEAQPAGLPIAVSSGPTITTAGSGAATITVVYKDDTGLNTGSLGANDIVVTGPGTYSKNGSFVGFTGSGTSVTATYTVAAPTGGWTGAADGTYTISTSTVASAVTDSSGNAVPAGPTGTFRVAIPRSIVVTMQNDVVNAGDNSISLREAITMANDSYPSNDTITFAPGVSYITWALGQMFITDSVTIQGGGPSGLTFDADTSSRHFTLDGPGVLNVTFTGVQLTGGYTDLELQSERGGSIYNNGENLVMDNVWMKSNTSFKSYGGAIHLQGQGTLTFSNGKIQNNTSPSYAGGAISALDPGHSITIINSTVSGNAAGIYGGAVFSSGGGTVTIDASTFKNNSTTSKIADDQGGTIITGGGGAIMVANGKVINGSVLEDYPSISTLTVRDSLFDGNKTAVSGGAIEFNGNTTGVLLRNSTFVNNQTTGNTQDNVGGAVLVGNLQSNPFLIDNCTFAYNKAYSGGGLFIENDNFASCIANSTIFAQNSSADPTQLPPDFDGNLTANYCFFGVVDGSGIQPGSANNIGNGALGSPVDPKFDLLQDNGGPTFTLGLKSLSPCLNAGSNPLNLSNDQRGSGYSRVSGSGPDIGAFEVQVIALPPTVTNVVFGDGTAQRSTVRSIVVTFSEAVNFSPSVVSAFTLSRTGTGGTPGDVDLTASPLSGPTNSVTITFSGILTESGGSLVDGLYDFYIDAAQVSGVGGLLDGNNDQTPGGTYAVPGSTSNGFYRFFGDENGDGTVNQTDYDAFRLVFLGGPSTIFDFDNDGQVSQPDYNAFRLRFLGTP